MSQKVYIESDNHFSHENFLTFKDHNDELIRKFDTAHEMDELMIENHNKTVRPQDKTYFLGDLCFDKKRMEQIMPRLNGSKVLILGNHDKLKTREYLKYFKDVRSSHRLCGRDIILSHIPLHPYIFERIKLNVHGHMHSYNILIDGVPDPRYFNVCVEQHNYTPVCLDQIIAHMEKL